MMSVFRRIGSPGPGEMGVSKHKGSVSSRLKIPEGGSLPKLLRR